MTVGHFEYLVDRCRGNWTIMFSGQPHGRYPDRKSAMRAAIEDAARVCRLGHEVEVKTRRRAGSPKTIWTKDRLNMDQPRGRR